MILQGLRDVLWTPAIESCWVNVGHSDSINALAASFNQLSRAKMGGTAVVMMMVLVVAWLYVLYEWAIFRSLKEASIGEGKSRHFFPCCSCNFFSLLVFIVEVLCLVYLVIFLHFFLNYVLYNIIRILHTFSHFIDVKLRKLEWFGFWIGPEMVWCRYIFHYQCT